MFSLPTLRAARGLLSVCLYVLTLISLPGYSAAAEQQADDAISGAGAHFSWVVMDALKQDLEKSTGRKLTLYGRESMLGAGCNAGIKHATQHPPGKDTFGMACCPISKDEAAQKKLRVFPLALEPVLILVNKANPVNTLSAKQVQAIFRGDITNWKEVGGADEGIVVVTRLHCKKRPGHWKTILPSAKDFREQRLNVKSAAEMIKRVSAFKGGFGHTGAAWAFEEGDQVKAIKVDGIEGNGDSLKNKKYPFYRTLSIVTDMSPSDDLLKLVKESQQRLVGSDIARRYGLLPTGVGEQ